MGHHNARQRLLVWLCIFAVATLSLPGIDALPGEPADLLEELKEVEATEQQREAADKKGSVEKLKVMEEMAKNQQTMMSQMSHLASAAQKAEAGRSEAQHEDLIRCRADLTSARGKLRDLRRPDVNDWHRLISPRGNFSQTE